MPLPCRRCLPPPWNAKGTEGGYLIQVNDSNEDFFVAPTVKARPFPQSSALRIYCSHIAAPDGAPRRSAVVRLFSWNGPGEAAGGLAVDEEGAAGRDQCIVGHREAIGIDPTLVH